MLATNETSRKASTVHKSKLQIVSTLANKKQEKKQTNCQMHTSYKQSKRANKDFARILASKQGRRKARKLQVSKETVEQESNLAICNNA